MEQLLTSRICNENGGKEEATKLGIPVPGRPNGPDYNSHTAFMVHARRLGKVQIVLFHPK